jgi:hypothetical protein
MTAIIDSGCIVVEQAGALLKQQWELDSHRKRNGGGRRRSTQGAMDVVIHKWSSSHMVPDFCCLTPANKSCDSLRRSGFFGLPHFYCDSTTKLLDPGHHNRKRRQSREGVVTTGALILGFYEYIIRPGTP